MTTITTRKELDREQAAISEDNLRGLGLCGDWLGERNWYGGRIQQIMRLVKGTSPDEPPLRLELQKLQKTKSHHFGRIAGSRRIIQLKIPDTIIYDREIALTDFLQQHIVICGRRFAAFTQKDDKVYFVEIDEGYDCAMTDPTDRDRYSLEKWVQSHNPLSLNRNQVC